MSYWVEKGIQELEEWEHKVFSFLTERISSDAISYYLGEYQRDIRGLYEKAQNGDASITPSIYSAIASITQIRSLLDEIRQPLAENVTMETAARLAVLTFRVGLTTGMITPGRGMEVFEWEIQNLQEQHQFAGENALRASSKKATDVKYAPGRDLYREALDIARNEWLKGSPLKHHQMKQYLIKDYKARFAKFDPDCGYTEKGLLRQLKELANEMNRPDLISGQKKSS